MEDRRGTKVKFLLSFSDLCFLPSVLEHQLSVIITRAKKMKEKANLIRWLFVVIIMLVILCPIVKGEITPEAVIQYDGGTGEPNDPYLISTAEQLKAIGDPNINDKCFKLIADIDLDPNLPGNEIVADTSFIGTFGGTLDGNKHSISNMVVEDDPNTSGGRAGGSDNFGLIGFLKLHAVVQDIQLQNITIHGKGPVGALVAANDGEILRCSVSGSITGKNFVGGLVGDNWGDIVSCSAFCDVQSVQEGLVGLAGGLVGYNGAFGYITNCYAIGTVTGLESVGGLVGYNDNYISNCYAECTVIGSELVGGLVGENSGYFYFGYVSNCYARSTITGEKYVGGLIGNNDNPGTVYQCYAACEIIADPNDSIGGLIGKSSGRTMNSFWDVQVSGLKISAGGVGLTTAKLQDASTYISAGWDMAGETSDGLADIWTIAEPNSYPQLTRFTDQYPVIQLPGSGTKDDPYKIATAEDLAAINYYDINAHYAFVADIDLSGIIWSTAPVLVFNGTFDGRGHTISNLIIEGDSYLGLFGNIMTDAVVTNLIIQDACIIGNKLVGALAGKSRSHITDCHVTGNITGVSYVGGLAGLIEIRNYRSSSLEFYSNCSADVVLSGNDHVHNIANTTVHD